MRARAQPLLHEFSKSQFASPVIIALLTLPPQFLRPRPRNGLVNEREEPNSPKSRMAAERLQTQRNSGRPNGFRQRPDIDRTPTEALRLTTVIVRQNGGT